MLLQAGPDGPPFSSAVQGDCCGGHASRGSGTGSAVDPFSEAWATPTVGNT